jgi:hypothetical protein
MSARDASWNGVDHLRVVGPLAGVTVDTVRQALLAAYAADPRQPAVCRTDWGAHRWERLDRAGFAAWLDDLVSGLPDGEGAAASGDGSAAAVRRALARQPLGDRPLRVVLHRGFAGVRMTHAVGDGRVFNALVPRLLGADPATQPAAWRGTALPLLRASLAFFGRDPRRIAALLTVPRPVLPVPPADAPSRPWLPDPVSYHARLPQEPLHRLREWRDRHVPGVSAAAILFAATRAAFEDVGLVPGDRGLMMQVDARRYLPRAALVNGNFTAGQYVEPTDPRDPRAVHEAIAAATAAGRPLTTLALRDVYAVRSSGRVPELPARVRVAPAPQLTLTHIGRMVTYSGLPWAAPPGERVFLSAPTPAGTEGVTVSFAELDGAIHLNVTYHRSTFDEAAVRRAADLICTDTVGLVADGRPRAAPSR